MQGYLTTAQVAQRVGISRRTVKRWRNEGAGPVFVRPNGRRMVRYRESDVEAWLSSTETHPRDSSGTESA